VTAEPRVLLLTASYGSGHNRVAGSLAQTFRAAGAAVRVVDHFRELVHPEFDRLTRGLYYTMLRRTPHLWGMAYWIGDQLPVSSPLLLGLTRLGVPKLRRLLDVERPDVVVSVHPTPAAALSELAGGRHPVPPHTTVFTDFVAHTQWIYPHVDRYCVPAQEIARALVARGVPRERVTVTGIPVGAAFGRPAAERAATRLALGLSPRLPVVLLMDGAGGGFGRLEEATRVLLRMDAACQALVVTGRGRRLEARLRRLAAGRETRVKVFGYVDNIRELMGAADFLVSKAGGLTLAEALAAELPTICFGSLPGQECRNERFAAMAGVALLAWSPSQLERVLAAVTGDPVLARTLRERIRGYRRPHAAEHVVDLVLGRGERQAERAS
jgi:processive 1,2-diacylglycerol beta-glucosyltransferase